MEFIKKLSKSVIDRLLFYEESIGVSYRMSNALYFAHDLNVGGGIFIESCPHHVYFSGYSRDKMYFILCLDSDCIERRFVMYDIVSNQLKPINFRIDQNENIGGYSLVKENIFLISIKIESEYKNIIYNAVSHSWSWIEMPIANTLMFAFEDTLFYFSNTSGFDLIAFNLNTNEISWSLSLVHLTSYIDHTGGPAKQPGRVWKFVMLSGDELVLLTSNQLLISVDIKKHEIVWVSEPLLNYFPLNDFKFDYKEQKYYCINEAKYTNEELELELSNQMSNHSYFFRPNAVWGDKRLGVVYLIESKYLLEVDLKVRKTRLIEIASLLPFPQIIRLYTLFYSEGLLYITVSKDTAFPSIIVVYDPIVEKVLFVNEIKDGIMNILFFGDKFYLVGYDGHLYEFDRSVIGVEET